MSDSIKEAINKFGITKVDDTTVFAYEVNGKG
jgi:hypothetical protein